MGTLGKALIIINILLALAFVLVAGLDYGRRQAWSYVVLEQDFMIDGLPVDDQQLDVNGLPLENSVGPRMQRDLFEKAPGRPPVKTQIEEVANRKAQLNATAGNDVAKLQAILVPLAETAGKRSEVRATDNANTLNTRLEKYFNDVELPTKTTEGGQGLSLGERKQAIARLLFATSQSNDDYSRTLAVVGLAAYTRAASDQANILQNMIPVYQSELAHDSASCEVEHKYLLQQIVALAERVGDLQESLNKQTALKNQHRALVQKRSEIVADLQKTIANARKATEAAVAQQTKAEADTFTATKAVTETELKNQELERTVKSLESGR
jgi:hypothetical protein